jgi:hypothetical protein
VNFITSFSGSHWCWLCRCWSKDGTLPVMFFFFFLKLTIQLYGCALYISFSACSPYMLCTLYPQCAPFCWDLMSFYLSSNFTMTLCVAQKSDVSFSFWISSVIQLIL